MGLARLKNDFFSPSGTPSGGTLLLRDVVEVLEMLLSAANLLVTVDILKAASCKLQWNGRVWVLSFHNLISLLGVIKLKVVLMRFCIWTTHLAFVTACYLPASGSSTLPVGYHGRDRAEPG
jgi:hypothetical protein